LAAEQGGRGDEGVGERFGGVWYVEVVGREYEVFVMGGLFGEGGGEMRRRRRGEG